MFDVAIIGAGAAGLMCAGIAGQRGLKVVLIDHAKKLAEKIRISGGGRCNFTNRETKPENFISNQPDFCRSALSRYRPVDFLDLLGRHQVSWHEKHKGQLFCDQRSEQIIEVLRAECDLGRVNWHLDCSVHALRQTSQGYEIDTAAGMIRARQLVIATGGLSIPQIGATDFGYRIARQFGLKVHDPRPGLVPLTFNAAAWAPYVSLAGLSLEVELSVEHAYASRSTSRTKLKNIANELKQQRFTEDLLFTHRGLSGPAILQISSYWEPSTDVHINLWPKEPLDQYWLNAKRGAKQTVAALVNEILPRRLAELWLSSSHWHQPNLSIPQDLAQWRLADCPDRHIVALARSLQNWRLLPDGTEGWKKAEVTCAGVDTQILNQQTMAVKHIPNLYFIGEVVDVTGWLGGYNFQWAWSSAYACAMGLKPSADS